MMVMMVMMAMMLMMVSWLKTLGRGNTFALQHFEPELSDHQDDFGDVDEDDGDEDDDDDDSDEYDDENCWKRLILKEITWGSGTGWGHIIKKILGSDIVINVWRGTWN